MSTQLFKNQIPEKILIDFLEKYASKSGQFYIFTNTSYKQAIYYDAIDALCQELRHYYHKSKLYYIERKRDYSKLITILRQLCKANNVSYTSRIIYRNSKYDIQYYISIPADKLQ